MIFSVQHIERRSGLLLYLWRCEWFNPLNGIVIFSFATGKPAFKTNSFFALDYSINNYQSVWARFIKTDFITCKYALAFLTFGAWPSYNKKNFIIFIYVEKNL